MTRTDQDQYAPSPTGWVRQQVETIEKTGDTRSVHISHRPVVLLTMRGVKTGKIRKVPLMRVEHGGVYAAVGSKGGGKTNPKWVSNLLADPDIELQDGTESWPARARLLTGDERAKWWERAVEAFPNYATYQRGTKRQIPVFALEPR
jgi:deazaflavin-dependent oxidoreductase (nitroreductase family)